MPNPSERAAEILRGPDGRRICLLLLDYAEKIARRFGWRTGKVLPQGASPESVLHDVIIKVVQGQRSWDGSSETALVYALQGMIRSEIGHLFEKIEYHLTEPIAVPFHDGKGESPRQRTGDDFASSEADPEAVLLEQEQELLEEVAYEMVLKMVEDDQELSAVALALHDSHSPAEIASLTRIPVERVYQHLRTLYRKAASLRLPLIEREAKRRKP